MGLVSANKNLYQERRKKEVLDWKGHRTRANMILGLAGRRRGTEREGPRAKSYLYLRLPEEIPERWQETSPKA